MRTQLRYPSRQADSAYGRARVPTSQTKRPPFHGKNSLAGDCFHHPAASLPRDRVGDGGVVPDAMTDECLSRLRSTRAPSCPRVAGLSGAERRDVLSKVAGLLMGPATAGNAFPAFIKSRYSGSAVSTTRGPTTGPRPAGRDMQVSRLARVDTCFRWMPLLRPTMGIDALASSQPGTVGRRRLSARCRVRGTVARLLRENGRSNRSYAISDSAS
jgi:hypothetical protein